MSQHPGKSSTIAALAMVGAFAASLLGAPAPASAGPACSSLDVTLAEFQSCTVEGGGPAGQDTIENVQAALNDALTDPPTLIPFQSYYPGGGGGGGAGDEFTDPVLGLFEYTPVDFANNITFTFTELPDNTVFLTMKAGNGFEIFYLPNTGLGPLTHQLTPDSTSHFSTFAALVPIIEVPEPASLALLGGALLGFGLLGRRKRK